MIVTINGRQVSGSASEIAEILAKMERKVEGGTYFSDSKGEELYIVDMDTNHIRNAVLKYLRNWVASLHNTADCELFVEEIECGLVDETFDNLLAELKTR